MLKCQQLSGKLPGKLDIKRHSLVFSFYNLETSFVSLLPGIISSLCSDIVSFSGHVEQAPKL